MNEADRLNNIKQILGDWNPINVPDFIKEDEYKYYAFKINQNCKTEKEVQEYLTKIFTDDMGYELTEKANSDIKSISSKISKILAAIK